MSWAFEIPWHHNQRVRERHFSNPRKRKEACTHVPALENVKEWMEQNAKEGTIVYKKRFKCGKRELRRAAIVENIFYMLKA